MGMYPSLLFVPFFIIAISSVGVSDDRYKNLVAMITAANSTANLNKVVSKKIVSGCSALMIDVVRQCYRFFMGTFGLSIDSAGKLPPFQFFLHATSAYSLQHMCGPVNALMSCINSRVSSSCMNIAMFHVLTYGDDDAYNYLGSYASFEYICGSGYAEFVSNERCFVQASEDPEIQNRLQSCGIAVDPSNPTTTCNNALSDASCVRNIYEGYCGSQLAHGMCQTRVSFVKRLEVVDENCLTEMRTRCTSSAAYIIVSKLIVIVIILLIYAI